MVVRLLLSSLQRNPRMESAAKRFYGFSQSHCSLLNFTFFAICIQIGKNQNTKHSALYKRIKRRRCDVNTTVLERVTKVMSKCCLAEVCSVDSRKLKAESQTFSHIQLKSCFTIIFFLPLSPTFQNWIKNLLRRFQQESFPLFHSPCSLATLSKYRNLAEIRGKEEARNSDFDFFCRSFGL